jgi:hypothetical protein
MYPPFDQSAANGGSRNIAKNLQQPLIFVPTDLHPRNLSARTMITRQAEFDQMPHRWRPLFQLAVIRPLSHQCTHEPNR